MSNHDNFWHAIDCLAGSRQLTCSALARYSGLDATIFNKSKRFSPDGKPRWLSFGTIDKVLTATGISVRQFASYFPEDEK